jgi:hypothetical protein
MQKLCLDSRVTKGGKPAQKSGTKSQGSYNKNNIKTDMKTK